jgi:hypothetical protein
VIVGAACAADGGAELIASEASPASNAAPRPQPRLVNRICPPPPY